MNTLPVAIVGQACTELRRRSPLTTIEAPTEILECDQRVALARREAERLAARSRGVELPSPADSEGPTLSVVVTAHNVASWIGELLSSLLNQTFEDLEVLVVDDHSSDGTSEVIARVAAIDQRIRILKPEESGGAHARNFGADHARGTWLAFCDGDDLVPPDAYRVLLAAADDHDVVFGDFLKFAPMKTWRPTRTFGTYGESIESTSIADHPQLSYHRACWNKIFRTSFWREHDILFPEVVRSNDIVPMTRAYLLAKSVAVVPDFVYLYRERPGASSMTSAVGTVAAMRSYLRQELACAELVAAFPTVREVHQRTFVIRDGWAQISRYLANLDDADPEAVPDEWTLQAARSLLKSVEPDVFARCSRDRRLVYELLIDGLTLPASVWRALTDKIDPRDPEPWLRRWISVFQSSAIPVETKLRLFEFVGWVDLRSHLSSGLRLDRSDLGRVFALSYLRLLESRPGSAPLAIRLSMEVLGRGRLASSGEIKVLFTKVEPRNPGGWFAAWQRLVDSEGLNDDQRLALYEEIGWDAFRAYLNGLARTDESSLDPAVITAARRLMEDLETSDSTLPVAKRETMQLIADNPALPDASWRVLVAPIVDAAPASWCVAWEGLLANDELPLERRARLFSDVAWFELRRYLKRMVGHDASSPAAPVCELARSAMQMYAQLPEFKVPKERSLLLEQIAAERELKGPVWAALATPAIATKPQEWMDFWAVALEVAASSTADDAMVTNFFLELGVRGIDKALSGPTPPLDMAMPLRKLLDAAWTIVAMQNKLRILDARFRSALSALRVGDVGSYAARLSEARRYVITLTAASSGGPLGVRLSGTRSVQDPFVPHTLVVVSGKSGRVTRVARVVRGKATWHVLVQRQLMPRARLRGRLAMRGRDGSMQYLRHRFEGEMSTTGGAVTVHARDTRRTVVSLEAAAVSWPTLGDLRTRAAAKVRRFRSAR